MKPLPECRLYGFVDTAYLRDRSPEEITRQLCDGGVDLIQLRAKELDAEKIAALAERLAPIAASANVGLVINDHPAVARKVGAGACHMGQEDFFGGGYRSRSQLDALPSSIGLGLSTHGPEQAHRAVAAGADYVAVGPVYATPTKPSAQPVRLDYVRWAAAHIPIPWFAIGGINLENVDAVLDAGATRICVVSAILNASNIVEACQAFRKRLV